MVGLVEKRYSALRQQLDSLGYKEGFPIDALGLVEHLLTDLVQKNGALTRLTQKYAKISEVLDEFQEGVEPYKTQILKLTDENSKLRIHLLKTEENGQKLIQDNKRRLLELENENLDLKLLVSQFMVRVQELEVDSLQKTKELGIAHLESLEGVTYTSSDYPDKVERSSRRKQKQRMEMNSAPIPLCPHCVRIRNSVEFGPDRTKNPKVLDYLKIADSRIECLQLLVRKCKEDKEELKETIKELQQRLDPGGDNHQSSKGHSSHDPNVSIHLKTAQLQLNILQRRNIQLEDQLKQSILGDHGNWKEGKKKSKEIENGLMEGIIKAHGSGYPTIQEMTLQEKNKFLEAQLSHCCEEKAKLKFLLETCEEDRRGKGREGRHSSPPGSTGMDSPSGSVEYSRFRRVSSRSGGGGAPLSIRPTRPTLASTQGQTTNTHHHLHSTAQTHLEEGVETEELRNGEEEEAEMYNAVHPLPFIQIQSSRSSAQEQKMETAERPGREIGELLISSEPPPPVESRPSVPPKPTTTKPTTTKPPMKSRTDDHLRRQMDKGSTKGKSTVSLPLQAREPMPKGGVGLKSPSNKAPTPSTSQRKVQPGQSEPKTQNPALTFGKSTESRKGEGRSVDRGRGETQSDAEGRSLQNGTTTTTSTRGIHPIGNEEKRDESVPTSSGIQGGVPSSRSPAVSDGFSVSIGSSGGVTGVFEENQERRGGEGTTSVGGHEGSTSGQSVEMITIKSPPAPFHGQEMNPLRTSEELKAKDAEIMRLQLEIKSREEEMRKLESALVNSQSQMSDREGVVGEQESLIRSLRHQLGDLGSDLIQAQKDRSLLEKRVEELSVENGGYLAYPPMTTHPTRLLQENKGLRLELQKAKDEILFYDQLLQNKDEELKEFRNTSTTATGSAGKKSNQIHLPVEEEGREGVQGGSRGSSDYKDTEPTGPPLRSSGVAGERGQEGTSGGSIMGSLTHRIPQPTSKGKLLDVRPSGPLTSPRDLFEKESGRERVLEREILSLRTSLTDLDREKEGLVDELGRKEVRLSQLESKVLQQTTQVADLEQKLTLSQMEMRRNEEIASNQDRDLALLRRQLENARRDFDGLGRDRDELLKRLKEVSSVQSLTQLDRRTLQTELDKKNGQVDELRGKIQRYIEEVRRIEELLQSKEEENGVLLAQYRNLRDEFSELENAQVSLEKESDTARVSNRMRDQENSSLKTQLTKQSSLLSSYEQQIGRLSEEVSALESKLSLATQTGQNAESDSATLHSSYLSLEKKLDSLRLELANCVSNRKKMEGENDDLRNRNSELERILGLESENMSRLQEIVDTYKETKELQDEKILKLIQENGRLEEQILKLMDRNEKLHEELGHYRLKCAEGAAELDRIRRLFQTEKMERETAMEELKNLRHHLTTSSATMLMNSALYSRGSVSPVTSQLGTGRTGDNLSGGSSLNPTGGTFTPTSPNPNWTGGEESK